MKTKFIKVKKSKHNVEAARAEIKHTHTHTEKTINNKRKKMQFRLLFVRSRFARAHIFPI